MADSPHGSKPGHDHRPDHGPDHSDSLSLSSAERNLMDDPAYPDRLERLDSLTAQTQQTTDPVALAPLKLEIAGLHLDLDDRDSAGAALHGLIDIFIEQQQFEQAARTCQYHYLCEGDNAVSAIGQAAWLSVTYPVDPHLTVSILDNIVDETPDESDGAAVAAATAAYVVDIRAPDNEHLQYVTGAMLARVAKRHSHIDDQSQFEVWARTLEIDEPEKFLVRLRNVIDVMVQTDWWFDRDKLRGEIPAEDSST
jgi:hypothetical protein